MLAGFLSMPLIVMAQNTRLNDYNTIGWFTNTTTLRFSNRWSGHFEYQFRRDELVQKWQQSLLRTGINYHANDKLTLRLGYAWIETFPYGDYTIQAAGRQFPEHRLYQMATLNNPIGRVEISHRFMLEQRWFGRYLNADSPRPDETVYVNRLRYMFRAQMPIGKPKLEDKTPYVAAYDEILLGFGRNVGENVFDQNRLGLLLGYRFSPVFRLEGGFFQQIVQLPREIQNRNVFQYNNGIIVNTVVNMDLRKK
ncbi:long-chain fatty acid transporter [Spirosoma montaniterrae]|uniref:Long-chain fatty acid transporter n=1 Tax=Spirosoma montaniterrae TaxID=1178516 RepID=A0A1P9X474_9BACT|nr:long-chain fatty acid transporter [Spirosoma montaniterrae]